MRIVCCLMLVLSCAFSPAFAQLANFRLGFVYQNGSASINPDGTVQQPNIPEIPWTKYSHFSQSSIYPNCATSTTTPTVNSSQLDGVPSTWGKSFSRRFTDDAHTAGKLALVGLVGTNPGQDWPNATANSAQTQVFVNALLSYVNSNQYDGIDVDMEGVTPSPTQMVAFFQTLNATFKNAGLTWNNQPLLIFADTGWPNRDLNSLIYTYVDKLNEMTYVMDEGNYAGLSPHPWHYSTVRRDTTYTGPYYGGNPLTLGYGDVRNFESMDESIWYETYAYATPYSKFAVGIPFAGAAVQGPKSSTAGQLGVTALTDPLDPNVANEPIIYPEVPFGRLLTWSIYNSAWVGSSNDTPAWDDVTKASYIIHNAGQLATYYPNNGSYGEVYMYTNDGGATYQPSDAFISYPSVRFIQEAVKWANEQKPAIGQQTSPGYLGGTFVWTVLGDYLPGQTGDAQHPLSTALAEAQDLNAWTYSAPIWDNDTSVWQNESFGYPGVTVASVYDSTKMHRVTSITPPASSPVTPEAHLLNQPGGSIYIADTTRNRYFRFALKSTPPSTAMVFVYVIASDGNGYWVEYSCSSGPPYLSPATSEITFGISTMCDGGWHTHARDLLADLQVMVPTVTYLSQVNAIKVRPWPISPAVPTFFDDVTLFQYAPPLGDF
jgi:hypothetical protein